MCLVGGIITYCHVRISKRPNEVVKMQESNQLEDVQDSEDSEDSEDSQVSLDISGMEQGQLTQEDSSLGKQNEESQNDLNECKNLNRKALSATCEAAFVEVINTDADIVPSLDSTKNEPIEAKNKNGNFCDWPVGDKRSFMVLGDD